MPTIQKKIAALRSQLRIHGIDAYLIPGTDPHQSEITPSRWQTREWITGFTGSAGTVIVTMNEAALWTDFRYYIQAARELAGSGIILHRQGEPDVPDPARWLTLTLEPGATAAACAEELSREAAEHFAAECAAGGVIFKTVDDLLDTIWQGRPEISAQLVRRIPDELFGQTVRERLAEVRREIELRCRADYLLLSSLDDIAWVLNLRGSDVPYNPLFVSYLLVGPERAHLFIPPGKIPPELGTSFEEDAILIHPYASVFDTVPKLLPAGSRVVLSPEKTSSRLFAAVREAASAPRIIARRDVTTELKAVKHPHELEHMRRIHRYDGVSMVRFLHWFEGEMSGAHSVLPDELSAAEKLLAFRSLIVDFIAESFAAIVAFASNGALCHYRAVPGQSSPLKGNGLVVIDSGGQYLGGTTDITRTLVSGEPDDRQRREYTLVLKSHLAVLNQKFPSGTRGYQIDALARRILWDQEIDFGHGTGHGIGYMLNVHEGPQSISARPVDVPLKPGMVVSVEPGIYRDGEFGIRIENLAAVRLGKMTEFGQFLEFEDLTRCPYERRLIDRALLSAVELEQIDRYHALVAAELLPLLDRPEDNEVRLWLQEKTLPL